MQKLYLCCSLYYLEEAKLFQPREVQKRQEKEREREERSCPNCRGPERQGSTPVYLQEGRRGLRQSSSKGDTASRPVATVGGNLFEPPAGSPSQPTNCLPVPSREPPTPSAEAQLSLIQWVLSPKRDLIYLSPSLIWN